MLALIDKGAPVEDRERRHRSPGGGGHRSPRAISLHRLSHRDGSPTRWRRCASSTILTRDEVAAFLVGQFDLTHGALVARTPERFGIREVWQVEGDRAGARELFFEEETPPMRTTASPRRLDDALDTLSSSWLLRRYPWAGSLSTAHTVLYYDLATGATSFGAWRRSCAEESVIRGQRQGRAGALRSRRRRPGALPAKPRPATASWSASRRKVSRQAYGAVYRGLHVAAHVSRAEALPRAARPARGPRWPSGPARADRRPRNSPNALG